MITPDLIRALNPRHPDPDTAALKLGWAAERYGITTPLRVAHFLAQLAHESSLIPQEENLNYSAARLAAVWPNRYAVDPRASRKAPNALAVRLASAGPEAIANATYGGRMGNTEPGDGWAYRGRGLIQTTGRGLYADTGKRIGLDLIGNPDLLLQYGVSAFAAGDYWNARNLNARADRDDVRGVTLGINGGENGLPHREQLLRVAKRALGIK